jgi:plasmid stabilization system protein ParE
MTRFVLTPAARADLAEISDYISQDNPDAANRVLDELRAAMRNLAEIPEMGHSRRDLASETLRFWPVYSYLIIYRPEARPLQVVRVLHGSRDIRRILEEIS